ncbi:hypothetical protein [Paraburkholderia dinghuensis]|uniref:Uncharacterized protein n=1 Tax=Paraburkholderia dinghuensis TaxID=2305225 RepID=A0A3N6N8H6_9BURK|nr:hypothetical protein [Paraburkholderia dinghuensis]RQH05292.1 hypothetical protein D1Y85_14585 [Paraburkholderia dinghuensis]
MSAPNKQHDLAQARHLAARGVDSIIKNRIDEMIELMKKLTTFPVTCDRKRTIRQMTRTRGGLSRFAER